MKTGDRAAAQPGDTVVYRLSLRNLANSTLNNVVVTDTLPLGFNFLPKSVRAEFGDTSVPIATSHNASTVTFNVATAIPPGEVLNIAYAAQLTADAVRVTGENSAIFAGQCLDNNQSVKDGPATDKLRISNLQITGFYGNNVDGFQRDTIGPDGTSGYYFLSRRLLVPSSENVFIELEELNRPGTVQKRKQLSRGTDYEIDYDRGTLLFRQALLRTDVDENGQVLVRRIVATYQYESKEDSNIYGGRLQYNFSRELNRESWLGATYIKENQGIRDFELYGADALISLGPKSHLIAEYAHSSNDSEFLGPGNSRTRLLSLRRYGVD